MTSSCRVSQSFTAFRSKTIALAALCVLQFSVLPVGWAQVANTGLVDSSIVGNNNQQATDTGVAINGDVSGNVNSNQNNLSTGSNTNTLNTSTSNANLNQSIAQPIVLSPSNAGASSNGGNAVMVLPRNPLSLPNALLGRSNFGLQFGVNNNPTLSNLVGAKQALGWFLQAGITVPFGKIPDPLRSAGTERLDDVRARRIDSDRNVFGSLVPQQSAANTSVKGRLVDMNAYNYATLPSTKLNVPDLSMSPLDLSGKGHEPHLLALQPGEAYSKPLDMGKSIGSIEVGMEYPYLGHTKSGWIKILMPNGSEAWSRTQFEFIKYDYTEVDGLAASPDAAPSRISVAEAPDEVAPEVKKPQAKSAAYKAPARKKSYRSYRRYRRR